MTSATKAELEGRVPRASWSIREWASRHGFSEAFVYRELQAGRLGSVKLGGNRRIRIQDEEEYMEKGARPAA